MSFLTKKIYTIRMKLKKKKTNRGPLNIVYYVCFHYRFKQCNDNFDLLKKYKKKKTYNWSEIIFSKGFIRYYKINCG